MNDKDRGLTGPIDRAIRTTQGNMGGMGERALRQIAFASSAFEGRPTFFPRSVTGLALRSVGCVTGKPKLRSHMSADPQPSTGWPWLIGYVLYDEYSDELHEFIRRYLLLFDEATADRVLLVFVGNPDESGPEYLALRDTALREKDETDATAYRARLKTVGADYLRRDEVRSLRQGLEVSGEDLPCIVFFTGRARGARALLRIHQEWIADAAAQRQLARALVGFFRSEEFEKLLGTWMTKTERIQKFGTLINDHMARCLHTVGRQETPSRTILMLTEIKCVFRPSRTGIPKDGEQPFRASRTLIGAKRRGSGCASRLRASGLLHLSASSLCVGGFPEAVGFSGW